LAEVLTGDTVHVCDGLSTPAPAVVKQLSASAFLSLKAYLASLLDPTKPLIPFIPKRCKLESELEPICSLPDSYLTKQ
jgi:hypothetical protein